MRHRYEDDHSYRGHHSTHRDYNDSRSRSRQKQRAKRYRNRSRSPRKPQYRQMPVKQQSDIKNHFKFQIQPLSRVDLERVIQTLKQSMVHSMGPIEHITRSKQNKDDSTITLNVGFKYDLDAMSYLQHNFLSLKIDNKQIRMNSKPTKVFKVYLSNMQDRPIQPSPNQYPRYKMQKQQRHSSKRHQKQKKYSPSSGSYSPERKAQMSRILIFGVPMRYNEKRILSMINQVMGGSFICHNYLWRKIKGSCCEYFQFELQPFKAIKLIQNAPKMHIDGRPIIAIEDANSLSQALSAHQITLQLPSKVQPFYVVKALQSKAKVVQITANQQFQQDGKCKKYSITLNDKQVAHQLRMVGKLASGILVDNINHKEYVYRPTPTTLLPL